MRSSSSTPFPGKSRDASPAAHSSAGANPLGTGPGKRGSHEARIQVDVLRAEIARLDAELAAKTEALERATHAAEAAAESRDRFLSSVSHELRTPLSAILLWSSLIDEQKITDRRLLDALDAIKRSAEEQRALMDDLVDTSRLLAGRLRLDPRETDIVAVIRSGVASAAADAASKGIVLEEAIDPAPERGRVDPQRLNQVLRHLLLNAIKFTPPNGRVRVELRRTGQELCLVVADTGQGIATDQLAGIFEPRPGSADKCARTESGLGLGLALARRLVELHGGSLTAQSDGPGRGATFTARIPLPMVREADRGAPLPG